ncbi:MAG: hydroxyacid dehydrogenase [Pseudomonadota bacterium]|nr:hydroxyacid dehydrogenase [Pseudomonadota bacterium]
MESWRITYFGEWAHKDGLRKLSIAPNVELQNLEFDTNRKKIWSCLLSSDGYQVSSARHELPEEYHVSRAFLEKCPSIKAVSVNGAGFDTVDVQACTDRGVIVVNQAGANKEAVAEHVLGMMLALSKRMLEMDRSLRRERGWHRNDYMGTELFGKTVGIIGLGNVGSRVAELCGGLFQMQVCAYDPYLSEKEIEVKGASTVELESLLERSDFVSVNCPLTTETAGMINSAAIRQMKKTAYLITTARGGIVDEGALVGALENGRLRGAGVDVWAAEPPPLNHKLINFDNVILTMHTAGITEEARQRQGVYAAEQWLQIAAGKRPARLVNPSAWDGAR